MANGNDAAELHAWLNSTVVLLQPTSEVQSVEVCLNASDTLSGGAAADLLRDSDEDDGVVEDPVPRVARILCPRVWDGLLCWPPTPPDQVVLQRCPTNSLSDVVDATAPPDSSLQSDGIVEFAWRHCTSNGSWASLQLRDAAGTDVDSGGLWHPHTNFSACSLEPTIALSPNEQELYRLIRVHLPVIKQMSIVGYASSLALLVAAFSLLASLKRLRCARNKIHLHLFASFIVRAVVLVHKHSSSRHHDLSLECWTMMCLFHYSLMANYCWILVEGLYLHNLIFNSLYADGSSIAKYIIMGWGLPVPCVVVWAIARSSVGNDTCWASDSKVIQWLLRGPITLSIVLNFIFFINITRVVFIKMSNSHEPEARRVKYRKWFKSTLVLVPLFGAHHTILMVMSIAAVTPLYELYWLYIDQLFTSFQGSVVALLYCFCNGEVQAEVYRLLPESLKRKLFAMRRGSREPTSSLTHHKHNRASRNGHVQEQKFVLRHSPYDVGLVVDDAAGAGCGSDDDAAAGGGVKDDNGIRAKKNNEIPLEVRITREVDSTEAEARL